MVIGLLIFAAVLAAWIFLKRKFTPTQADLARKALRMAPVKGPVQTITYKLHKGKVDKYRRK